MSPRFTAFTEIRFVFKPTLGSVTEKASFISQDADILVPREMISRFGLRSGHKIHCLVRMKKKTTPMDLVGSMDERWSAQVRAAEYFPMRVRAAEREAAES